MRLAVALAAQKHAEGRFRGLCALRKAANALGRRTFPVLMSPTSPGTRQRVAIAVPTCNDAQVRVLGHLVPTIWPLGRNAICREQLIFY
jgi:hypothetical protein